ncbi:MAG: FAD-dependent oxidoreductase [Oscillospiraceae bacterium]|nr:FAD-dependent oxidoreductase [Oscillospiraceae bacterium]
MKHVIIGVGAAGIVAANTISKHRPNDQIVMISADDAVYSRCMLHKYIGGGRSVEALSFVSPNFFEARNIVWRKGISVTGIDTAAKTVSFDGGTETYDKLLIATGAKSALPPIEGVKDCSGVYGLRDLADATAIRDKAAGAEKIVIVGAGLVGLDAAYGLIEMGKKPMVIDMAKSVLSANLDERAAEVYQTKFEEAGCVFRFESKVSKVRSDGAGNLSCMILGSGEEIPCDLLIIAVGINPESKLLPGKPDKYLKVGDDSVFAAGDATGLSSSWPSAMEQGEVAALNMCGIETVYEECLAQRNTVNFFGIASVSVGRFLATDGDTLDVRVDKGRYQKIVINDGVPAGVILQGDISRCGFWQYLIRNNVNIEKIPRSVWKVSFADAYGLNQDGEYEWVK